MKYEYKIMFDGKQWYVIDEFGLVDGPYTEENALSVAIDLNGGDVENYCALYLNSKQ